MVVVPTLTDPEWGEDPYPLPFHPLEMSEDALHALFGFVIEGCPETTDIDSHEIAMHGFRVTDPTGREQAEWEAAYAEAIKEVGPLRVFRTGPDGTMHEKSLDDLWPPSDDADAAGPFRDLIAILEWD
jgi:hypothetical protein